MKITKSGLILVLSIAFANLSLSEPVEAGCVKRTCISVTTDPKAGGIVIKATQDSPGSTTKPKPRVAAKPRVAPKPTAIKRPPRPKPIKNPQVKPAPRKWAPVPRAAKTFAPKVVAALSLSDTLTQLIPLRQIYTQPSSRALTGIPIYFWTTTNPYFSTITKVLGISVGLSLTPTFTWNFGDGSTMQSSSPGGSYPLGELTHNYRLPGQYQISLAISWAGSWSAQGSNYPVIGDAIVQHLSSSIQVLPAPTYYNQ